MQLGVLPALPAVPWIVQQNSTHLPGAPGTSLHSLRSLRLPSRVHTARRQAAQVQPALRPCQNRASGEVTPEHKVLCSQQCPTTCMQLHSQLSLPMLHNIPQLPRRHASFASDPIVRAVFAWHLLLRAVLCKRKGCKKGFVFFATLVPWARRLSKSQHVTLRRALTVCLPLGLAACRQARSQLTLPVLPRCLAVAAVLLPAVSLQAVLWRLGLLPGGSVLAGCRVRLVVCLGGHLGLPHRYGLVGAAAGPRLAATGG